MGDTGVDINEHRETPSHQEYRMLVGLDHAFIPNQRRYFTGGHT